MRRCLFGILMLVVFCGCALAGTVTYDQASSPATVGLSSSVPFSGNLYFPQWDPALFSGNKLDNVVFTLGGDIRGSLTVTNNASTSGDFSASSKATLTMTVNGTTTVIIYPLYDTGLFSLAASGQAGDSRTFSDLSSGTFTNSSPTISTGLSAFQGSSTFFLPLSGAILNSNSNNVDPAHPPTVLGTTNATAFGTVTYNYSPITTPEPATLALMGSALAGLGLFYRRRRA